MTDHVQQIDLLMSRQGIICLLLAAFSWVWTRIFTHW